MDKLEIIVNIATILMPIITFFSIYTLCKQEKRAIDHDKKKDTIDAFNKLQNEVLDILYKDYQKKRVEDIILNWRKKEYIDEYRYLGTLVARIEHFCVGVKEDIYSQEIVFKLANGFIDGTLKERIMMIIDERDKGRTLPEKSLYQNIRFLFNELEKLK